MYYEDTHHFQQQHIRLWTVQVHNTKSMAAVSRGGGGWNKVGIKKDESIPTSSEESSFDGLAHTELEFLKSLWGLGTEEE